MTTDLTIAGSRTLSIETDASLTINPNVVLTNNGTILAVSGSITFKSDASGSAYIGNSSSTNFIGSNFIVERYIPANRAFRFLSTPITTTGTIRENWQDNGGVTPGVGTHIIGAGGFANGFDDSNTNNPSMFTHNNATEAWTEVSNATTGSSLSAGTPYRIMIRGDRTTNLSSNSATPSATTLSSTGTLTYEGTTFSPSLNTTENGFSLVGNPYQAPVNMNTILAAGTNVNTTDYWVWDQNLNTRGGYTTVAVATGVATGGSGADEFLQPGQGAFIQTAAAGAASIQCTQASKDVTESATAVFKTSGKATSGTSILSLNLYESAALAENKSAADGLLIMFDASYSNDTDIQDAVKFTNLDESFSTSNDGKLLSIERRTIPTDSEEIQLDITTYRNTNYTIVAEGTSLTGETAYLVDSYTNTSTEIPADGSVNYAYSIDENDEASTAADRFKINFAAKNLSVVESALEQVGVYPNPVTGGKIFIEVPSNLDDLEVTIHNALGMQLFSENELSTGSKTEINIDFIKNKGVYFVKFTSKGNSITKKLMIN